MFISQFVQTTTSMKRASAVCSPIRNFQHTALKMEEAHAVHIHKYKETLFTLKKEMSDYPALLNTENDYCTDAGSRSVNLILSN